MAADQQNDDRHRPAPYPQSDTVEYRAVVVFQDQIDAALVKADIEVRDKKPNVDGTVTLVDAGGYQIGKFEVQVKAIPSGKRSYSCPSSLIAYSKVCFSPVLLVCVDVANELVYWRHIHAEMPEYKENQKSFTIHFNLASDQLTGSLNYIQMWQLILEQYRGRYNGSEFMRTTILSELSLSDVPLEIIAAFQSYVDEINKGLDTEFRVLKSVIFPKVWKFGVAILECTADSVSFQEFAIEKGSNGPLLLKIPPETKFLEKNLKVGKTASVSLYRQSPSGEPFQPKLIKREQILEPELLAKSYLFDIYELGRQEGLFRLGGVMLCRETIFAFVDQFRPALGLPAKDKYSLDELFFSALSYLPAWYELAVLCCGQKFNWDSSEEFPTLDNLFTHNNSEINRVTSESVHARIAGGLSTSYRALYFVHLYYRQLLEGLRTLQCLGHTFVERLYKEIGQFPIYLVDVSDRAALDFNLTLLVENLFSEYKQFANANGLVRPLNGKFLSDSVVFAYYVQTQHWVLGSSMPDIHECELYDEKRSHPKSKLYFGEPRGRNAKHLTLLIDQSEYRMRSIGPRSAKWLFTKRPLQEWIYYLLAVDGGDYNPVFDRLR